MESFQKGVFILLIAVTSIHCKVFLAHRAPKTGTCNYKGYVPGGHGPSIKRITSPEAKLQEQQMSMFAFKDPTAKKIKTQSEKYYNQLTAIFGDICPQVGVGLGLLGLATMIEKDATNTNTPTHADVVKAVNKAFDQFTKDINERFDRMEHYVNHQIMKSERDLVNVKLRAIFKKWEDCLDERTKNGAIDCQIHATRDMRGETCNFFLFKLFSPRTLHFLARISKVLQNSWKHGTPLNLGSIGTR